jgi:hypothetical protein
MEVWTRITASAVYDYSLNDKTLFPVRHRNYFSLLPWECFSWKTPFILLKNILIEIMKLILGFPSNYSFVS